MEKQRKSAIILTAEILQSIQIPMTMISHGRETVQIGTMPRIIGTGIFLTLNHIGGAIWPIA